MNFGNRWNRKSEEQRRAAPVQDVGATEPLYGGNVPVTGNQTVEDIGPTEPLQPGYGGGSFAGRPGGGPMLEDIGETTPLYYNDRSSFGESGEAPTAPVKWQGGAFELSDDPPADEGGIFEDTSATAPISPDGVFGFTPVVGWLVCIEGADRGKDYRLYAGYNNIGRDPSMDVCISGDMQISKDRHARVGFDPDESLFFFGPDNGKNLVKVNGKVIMSATELNPRDVLTIGSSKLMFIPLCTKEFNWKDE